MTTNEGFVNVRSIAERNPWSNTTMETGTNDVSSENKTYLGDSVYVQFDGYHIVLTTENGLPTDPSNTIALEPAVLRELMAYKNRLLDKPAPQSDKPIDPRLMDRVSDYVRLAESYENAVKTKGAAYTEVLEALKDISFVSVSMDTLGLNLSLAGSKRDLEKLWRKLRHLGFEAPTNRPEANSSQWAGFFRHDPLSVYVIFTSTVCKRVPTGRKIETDEYEIVCDE